MNLLKSAVILLGIILISFKSYGQTADVYIKRAEKELGHKFPDYNKVVDDLNKALELRSTDQNVYVLLSLVLLEQKDRQLEAFPYVKKVCESIEDHHEDFDFYLGYLHHLRGEFDEALHAYTMYKDSLTTSWRKEKEVLSTTNYLIRNIKQGKIYDPVVFKGMGLEVDSRITQCNMAKEITNSPVNVKILNMGDKINSEYDEYGPVLSELDSLIFFTSRRPIPNHIRKDSRDELFLEHVFSSYYDLEEDSWSPADFARPPLNDFKNNVSALTITPDGTILFIYDQRNNGDILYSIRNGDKNWTKPESFAEELNSKYTERSFTIAESGTLVIFERDNDTHDNRDIYFSQIDSTGWSKPAKIKGGVNTSYNEDGVFLHSDGETLYFSSKGHNSIGGYDIFKSTWQDSVWSKPVNLGYPINSVYDDIYAVVNKKKDFAFISSNRPGGNGGMDLYAVNLKPLPETQIISYKVIDNKTKKPVDKGDLVVIDSDNRSYSMESKGDGNYTVVVPNEKRKTDFQLIANRQGYEEKKVNFSVADTLKTTGLLFLDIKVLPKKDSIFTYVFNDTYLFDLNSDVFFEKYYTRLETLIDALIKYDVKVSIVGHTDSSGDSKYNKKLSKKRASSVKKYLTKKGVPSKKIVISGMGEESPVNDNSTLALRKLNRRVEVNLLKSK